MKDLLYFFLRIIRRAYNHHRFDVKRSDLRVQHQSQS